MDTGHQILKKGVVSSCGRFTGIGFDSLARECYRLTQAFRLMVSGSTLPGVFAISAPSSCYDSGVILLPAPLFMRLKFQRVEDETTR